MRTKIYFKHVCTVTVSTVKSFGSEFRKFLSDTQQDPPHLVEDHHKIEVGKYTLYADLELKS